MPNTTHERNQATDWVSTLQRLEKIGAELRKSDEALPPDQREPLEVEFVDLQENLPADVLLVVRPRFTRGGPLVASAYGARCGACYVSLPRGDHTAVLSRSRIVPCQYCGVLLYADDGERARVAAARDTRAKTRGRRK